MLLHKANVFLCVLRKILKTPSSRRVALPAGQRLVLDLDAVQHLLIGWRKDQQEVTSDNLLFLLILTDADHEGEGGLTWEMGYDLVVHFVGQAHFNLWENVQDVQLGESQAEVGEKRRSGVSCSRQHQFEEVKSSHSRSEAIDHMSIFNEHQVQPTTSSLPARGHTKFLTPTLEQFSDLLHTHTLKNIFIIFTLLNRGAHVCSRWNKTELETKQCMGNQCGGLFCANDGECPLDGTVGQEKKI